MKNFRVEEEYVARINRIEVASDGEPVGEPYDVDSDSCQSITLGYNVFEEDEEGYTWHIEFYPVQTDMRTFKSNKKEVLEQIKSDYPAPDWQNNEW